MKSRKIRLHLSNEQLQLCHRFSDVSRNYWNLLVEIDRLNNTGEFDDYLEKLGASKYVSNKHGREVYSLTQSLYMKLAKHVATIRQLTWYFQPNQFFIYSSIAREIYTVRRLNRGVLSFRSKSKIKPSFPVRCDKFDNSRGLMSRIYLKDSRHLQIPTLGVVKIGKQNQHLDLSCKKQVSKLRYDGKYWYLIYVEDVKQDGNKMTVEHEDFGIGIDLGIRHLATMSDGTVVDNIKTLRRYKILNKRLCRLQRKLANKYKHSGSNKNSKTSNIVKLEREIMLVHRSIRHLRENNIRELVSSVIKKNPSFICIEDLNVSGMLKNKYLSRDISNCAFYTIRESLVKKAHDNGIEVRLVNRFYPSSKLCSNCGTRNQNLRLSDRTFKCDCCGLIIDRDLNASINLRESSDYEVI